MEEGQERRLAGEKALDGLRTPSAGCRKLRRLMTNGRRTPTVLGRRKSSSEYHVDNRLPRRFDRLA
jgi:hypothetical protein